MEIPIKEIECYSDVLREEFLPYLIGKVFHVTTARGFREILKSGSIVNNKDEDFDFAYPQSGNSYGRKRGYICLVDLRDVPDEKLHPAIDKYYFLNPSSCNDNPVFLFISEDLYSDLILWTQARGEIGFKEMFVPYVESWYPGDISAEYIINAINLSVKHKPREFKITKEQEKELDRMLEAAKKRI